MRLARLIAPLSANPTAAAESLFLPLLMIAIGIWLNPLDPLWARGPFPWSWLAPVILALRYGPFSGLFSALLLLLAWYGLQEAGFGRGEFPKLFFLGGLIVTMVCGEFSSIWRARVRRAEAMQLYLDQRLEYLTHQHYLLRLSHDRLERDMIARPVAMREALSALRNLVTDDDAGVPLPGAQRLLPLLAQYCQLENAALYAVYDGEPRGQAVAHIGAEFQFHPDDALVRFALEENRLSHIQTTGEEQLGAVRYLIAAPLATRLGTQHGLLVVERVPFFALHDEMLQTLNLLLGYYADGLDARATAAPVLAAYPGCPLAFAFELQRLWRIRNESGVQSAIVALVFQPRAGLEDLLAQVVRQQRSLDVTWRVEHPSRAALLTLMPLASSAGAEGYLARIDGWIRQQHNLSLDEAGVVRHVLLIDELEPAALLQRVKALCNVPDEAWTVRAGT
jgi:hypothetical protein